MKIIYLIFFIFFNFFSFSILAQIIAIVDIQSLIDNNSKYQDKLKEIEITQKKYLLKFEIEEKELRQISEDIENSKLILSENEINIKIADYNKKLTNYTNMIEEFNYHYQNQIVSMREAVFNEIIKLLEKYATENNVDLILDSTSYLIASNSLDITSYINTKLQELNFKLEYNNFENN